MKAGCCVIRIYSIAIVAVMLPGGAYGQALAIDKWTPALPTKAERRVADAVSWATAIADVALDAKDSWDSEDRRRAFALQGVRVGVTYGAVFAVKTLVHRKRPCAPTSCGHDNPDFSFYSAHTALAFQTLGGPRLVFSLPLAVSTGGLRVAANKHWLTDVLAGAAIGAATSRIR